MVKSTLIFAMAIAFSAVCYAEDSPAEETILKIYSVGDLVSISAINSSMGGKTTSDEWASEYPETLKSLEELQVIIETMCSKKPHAVKAFGPSLSLIIRHSQAGHEEIEKLLQDLSQDNAPSIQLECRAIYSNDFSEVFDDEATEAEKQQLESLLSKPHFTKAETAKLYELLPSTVLLQETVLLKPGRRTAWGQYGRPCTAMGRVNRSDNTIDIRIDFIADDFGEATPFGTQVFSLAEGESAQLYHNCDGGTVVWLVTAKTMNGEPLPTQMTKRN